MNKIQNLILSIMALGFITTAPAANATLFTITGATFTSDSGYGVDANETNGTLLDVVFSTSSFTSQSFSLPTLANQLSYSFTVGTVDFEEPNSHGGILTAETDNLGVTAAFTFTDPLGITQNVLATGTATAGNISGAGGPGAVDYTLSWTPVTVNFGTGGQFQISLNGLSFSTQGVQTETATITLLNPGTSTDPASVPEPTTLVLLGLGLLGFAASGYMSTKMSLQSRSIAQF